MDKNALRPLTIVLAVQVVVAVFFAWWLWGPAPAVTRRGDLADDSTSRPVAPFGLDARTAWQTSRIRGTPDPPAPLVADAAFPHLRFRNPVALAVQPDAKRMWVAEQGGKVYSFPLERECRAAAPAIDVATLLAGPRPTGVDNTGVQGLEALYGLAFHPRFAENRYCYLTYVVRGEPGKQLPDGTRVARFTVTESDPPTLDPASEQIVITWLQGGHNGGCLAFGPDGCLYISTGDGGFANPPDGLNSGQDISNLLSSVLRIDVDRPAAGRNYSIPPDNPFATLAGGRGEIWCYGLRNPWKMSFDRENGDLWVADVGWELWELVYRVEKGGNYGWSVVEGRQPVHPERKVGPTPILPPTVEIPHTDGVSITGGYVYRGKRFPELVGAYVFGDWETRRIWSVRWDGRTQTATKPVDVFEPTVRLVAFAEDHDGELFLLDYDEGTILSPGRNERFGLNTSFPRRLSETGLFRSTAEHAPAPGVIAFSVNVEQWSDGALAERFIALPGKSTVKVLPAKAAIAGSMFSSQQIFPSDSVLVKTLSLPAASGGGDSPRRVETQLLHFDGKFWRGYSYAWNDEQTDAELIDAAGGEVSLSPSRTWHFPSRMECARCHNQWAEYALAFNPRQLNRVHDYGAARDNQLRTLAHVGALELPPPKDAPTTPAPAHSAPSAEWYADHYPRLSGLADDTRSLDQRVRSYLHVNCAHCHRQGGGGTAYIELQEELPIEATKALDVRPTQGTFDISDARILAPGDPYRSTLFYRIAKTGSGRMPHIGSETVDPQAVDAVHAWIRQLPIRSEEAAKLRELRSLVDDRPLPDDPDDRRREEKRRGERTRRRGELIGELLATTSRALYLARAMDEDPLPAPLRDEVLAAARGRETPSIRDLFEPLQPPEFRVKRLGAAVKPDQILRLAGDAERGRKLFFETAGVQCKNCHRIDGTGSLLGPDLSQIGRKYARPQLLEQILEPSKVIEPKYVSYVVALADGRLITGLLADRTDAELVVRDAKDQLVRVAASEVEAMTPQRQSLMPDLQLRDLTAEQVADLLAFLVERR